MLAIILYVEFDPVAIAPLLTSCPKKALTARILCGVKHATVISYVKVYTTPTHLPRLFSNHAKDDRHIAPLKAGCLLRIKSAAEMFKPAEKAVAEFVLANPSQVMQMLCRKQRATAESANPQ